MIYSAAEAQTILDALTPELLEELAREEPDWNDICADTASAELFVAAPDLAASVIVHANASDALRRAILEHLAAIDEVTHGAAPHDRVVAAEAALRALVATPNPAGAP